MTLRLIHFLKLLLSIVKPDWRIAVWLEKRTERLVVRLERRIVMLVVLTVTFAGSPVEWLATHSDLLVNSRRHFEARVLGFAVEVLEVSL